MTIQQAINQRIQHVRLPEWEPSAFLELPLLPHGECGPWAIIHDCTGEVSVLIFTLLNDSENRYEIRAGADMLGNEPVQRGGTALRTLTNDQPCLSSF